MSVIRANIDIFIIKCRLLRLLKTYKKQLCLIDMNLDRLKNAKEMIEKELSKMKRSLFYDDTIEDVSDCEFFDGQIEEDDDFTVKIKILYYEMRKIELNEYRSLKMALTLIEDFRVIDEFIKTEDRSVIDKANDCKIESIDDIDYSNHYINHRKENIYEDIKEILNNKVTYLTVFR